MTELTDQERDTIRTGALGALSYVSRSDPGFFAMFKESSAGAKAIAQAPEDVRALFTGGILPSMPDGEGNLDDRLLRQLSEATAILDAKAPEQAQGYRDVILQAVDAVAGASKGVSDDERAAIERVRQALQPTGAAGAGADQLQPGDPLPPPTGEPA